MRLHDASTLAHSTGVYIMFHGMSRPQEGLPCPDGDHCAYAHDVSELDVQLINKASEVRPVHLRLFGRVFVVNQGQVLRSLVSSKPVFLVEPLFRNMCRKKHRILLVR